MKTTLALLCALPFLFAPHYLHAEAKIQLFFDYRGPNQYDYKVVSTWQEPTSAYYLLPDANEGTQVAACYTGSPQSAVELLKAMVDIYNDEYHQDLSVLARPYFDPGLGSTALHLDLRSDDGSVHEWFHRLRECVF